MNYKYIYDFTFPRYGYGRFGTVARVEGAFLLFSSLRDVYYFDEMLVVPLRVSL